MTKKIISVVAVLVLFIFSSFANVYADFNVPGGRVIDLPPSPTSNFTGSTFITQLIGKVLPIVLAIGGFIAVIIIIISGIQFTTSSGNPEGAAAARNRLLYAIVGFVIIILAFAVLQIVNNLFLGNTGIV